MKLKRLFLNIYYVILNLFLGWLSFCAYAWLFITDRKDAEAESFVTIGYFMFVVGILGLIAPKIFYYREK